MKSEAEKIILEACVFEQSQFYQEKQKMALYYQILNRWLFLKIKGESVADYLKNLGYQKAAIYGMAELGCRLYEELSDTDIELVFVMDRNPLAVTVRDEIKALSPSDDNIPETDVIIVTPVLSYESIKTDLEKKVCCAFLCIKDLIYAM